MNQKKRTGDRKRTRRGRQTEVRKKEDKVNERVIGEVGPNEGRSMSWKGQFCVLYVPHSSYSSILMMEAASFPEMLVIIYHISHVIPKRH
jgi:hypothetical protein